MAWNINICIMHLHFCNRFITMTKTFTCSFIIENIYLDYMFENIFTHIYTYINV